MAVVVFRLLCWLPVFLGLAVARAETDGMYEPEVKWSKRRVVVCWADPRTTESAFTEVEKRAVRSVIAREFTLTRTGIEFVGWGDCASTRGFDLFIDTETQASVGNEGIRSKSGDLVFAGMAEIGEGGELGSDYWLGWQNPLYWGRVGLTKDVYGYLKKKKTKKRMQLYHNRSRSRNAHQNLFTLLVNALHEFGHMAGLRHEHARPEALTDPNCALRRQNPKFRVGDDLYVTTQISGPYDPNSIMNYCWQDVLKDYGDTIFHYRSPDAFKKSGHPPIAESGQKFPTDAFPWLRDTSLYTVDVDAYPGFDRYHLRLALSREDVRAVACMYRSPRPAGCEQAKPDSYKITYK